MDHVHTCTVFRTMDLYIPYTLQYSALFNRGRRKLKLEARYSSTCSVVRIHDPSARVSPSSKQRVLGFQGAFFSKNKNTKIQLCHTPRASVPCCVHQRAFVPITPPRRGVLRAHNLPELEHTCNSNALRKTHAKRFVFGEKRNRRLLIGPSSSESITGNSFLVARVKARRPPSSGRRADASPEAEKNDVNFVFQKLAGPCVWRERSLVIHDSRVCEGARATAYQDSEFKPGRLIVQWIGNERLPAPSTNRCPSAKRTCCGGVEF